MLLLGSLSLLFSFSFNGLRIIYTLGFRAEQRVSMLSLLEATNRVITAGLVALVVFFRLSLLWAYILVVYSDLPFFIVLVIIARRRFHLRIRFSLTRLREYLFKSLSLTGYDVLTFLIGKADLILLLALVGPLSMGIYSLAARITDPLISIAYAYVLGLYPLLCIKFEEGRQQFALVYQEATRMLALAIIPLAIFVSIEASAIVALLGGKHFAPAATAVQLLMWAMTATFFSQLAARSCMAANMEKLIPYVTVASGCINILASLILIPRWPIAGAATAALLSQLVGLSLFSVLLIRHVHLLQILSGILRVLVGNLPMLVFLLWRHQEPLLLTAPIALLLTTIGCMATRVLSLKDVSRIQRILCHKEVFRRY